MSNQQKTQLRNQGIVDFYKMYFEEEQDDSIERFVEQSETTYFLDIAELDLFDSEHVKKTLLQMPEKTLQNAAYALAEITSQSAEDIVVRPTNPPEKYKTGIRNIRTDDINDLLFINGTIGKSTDIQPKIDVASFVCPSCGYHVERVISDEEIDNRPRVVDCPNSDQEGHSESTKEMKDISMTESRMEDYQRMRIQEKPEDMEGDNPKSIDVMVTGDELAGTAMAGQSVTISGILRVKQKDDDIAVLQRHIQGVNVELEADSSEDLTILEEDIEKIKELSQRDDIYEVLGQAIAPDIEGYDEERQGAVFLLFSGVTKEYKDSENTRGNIHILYVGDPGTGKSRILRYVSDLSPSTGVFTSGKGASSAGITAAAVKDKEFGGNDKWTLKAGALVMADQGIACVDELDKMSDTDRAALHEGLEQQQISISKAGINATLNSRCSLFAAANPKHGRFHEHEKIDEQIDLQPALISRFDLIFAIKDEAERQKDKKVAKQILENNIKGQRNVQKKNEYLEENEVEEWGDPTHEDEAEIESLDSPVEKDLFKKYIAYAQNNYYPVLTDEAEAKIQDFYVNLREEGKENTTPITARALPALIRLTEAAARVKLSNEATVEHAQKAINIYMYHMAQVGMDPETGELDAGMIDSSTTGSQRNRVGTVRKTLKELDDGDGVTKDELLAEIDDFENQKIRKTLEKLSREGQVMRPETGKFKLVG